MEILDLCSERGVTVDQKPIAPLSWIEITAQNKLQLGSVLVGVESEESKNDDASILHGEDEEDIIDCSLEVGYIWWALPTRYVLLTVGVFKNPFLGNATASRQSKNFPHCCYLRHFRQTIIINGD